MGRSHATEWRKLQSVPVAARGPPPGAAGHTDRGFVKLRLAAENGGPYITDERRLCGTASDEGVGPEAVRGHEVIRENASFRTLVRFGRPARKRGYHG
jgi:hypothetical protein